MSLPASSGPDRLGSVASPVPGALVEWPAAFGRRFIVTVDVEEEFDWTGPLPERATVAATAALPPMHRRFVAAGVAPLYLVDHPVATDPQAIDRIGPLLDDAGTAIGAQLHPWVNPPFDRSADTRGFVGALPRALEAAKLDTLTAAITAAFGTAPIAYRAGRYGIGPNSFALLAERGYRIDTSMRARHDYRVQGGADFTAIGPAAFRAEPDGALIEMPLTTVYTGALARHGVRLHPLLGRVPRGRGLFARTGLLSRVPLSPEGTPLREAETAIEAALAAGERLLVFSFHSPSLVPGNTPYVRDAADLRRFHGWWDGVFEKLCAMGVSPVGQAEIVAAAGLSAPLPDR